MKRYTLLLEIREIVVIFAIINKIKTMKLTVKDGLFSFETTNQEEEILLNKIKECIEFGEPIPIEIQEEYSKLLNSAYLESTTEAINAAWRRMPNGRSIFALNFLAAFAKPLLCAGRFISTKFNLKTK